MPTYKFYSNHDPRPFDLFMRTLETLLAGRVAASMRILTHEILTPVQGVMSDLQDIQYKHKNNNHADDERILSLMQSNIGEINRLAKQIHVLLSEDITPSPQRIRKVVVHKLIDITCGRLKSVTEKKYMQFHNRYNNGIKAVDAVPDQLEIVFSCLLDNAAKYSFAGKIDNKRTIDIYYEDVSLSGVQALKISIQNYGCPITKEEIEQRSIFELGYRGDFSGDKGRQGTGSGLYIVDRIVEAHSGKIEVESKFDGDPNDIHQAINTFSVFWPKNFAG
jgi:signal transduction histidine kinase